MNKATISKNFAVRTAKKGDRSSRGMEGHKRVFLKMGFNHFKIKADKNNLKEREDLMQKTEYNFKRKGL